MRFFMLLFIVGQVLELNNNVICRLIDESASSYHGTHSHIFVSLIWSLSMMYDWASLDHVIVCDKLPVSWSPLSVSLGPLSPPQPWCLLVSGLVCLPDVRNASHPPCWPHTDLTPNSIHLPTSQIRWQLSVWVNNRVIRTMKIFLSQPTLRSDHQVYNWDHPLYTRRFLPHFLGFPQLSPALQ